jgi:hypothetical protein
MICHTSTDNRIPFTLDKIGTTGIQLEKSNAGFECTAIQQKNKFEALQIPVIGSTILLDHYKKI